MIIVKGAIPVKSDQQQEAVELVQSLADASREEHGCLAYEVYLRADDPDTIVIWQQWDCIEALEDHFASDHVDAFLDAIPDMIDGEVESARFEVQSLDDEFDGQDGLDVPQVQLSGDLVLH